MIKVVYTFITILIVIIASPIWLPIFLIDKCGDFGYKCYKNLKRKYRGRKYLGD